MAPQIVDWPAAVPIAWMQLDLIGRSLRARSPLTGKEVVTLQPGSSWQGVIGLRNLMPYEWQLFEGFRAGVVIGGRIIRVPDKRSLAQLGGASGAMTATGTANALTVTISGIGGWSPYFVVGTRLTIGERFHVVTSDVTAAPGGVANVPIAPELRETVAGAVVNVTAPTVLVRLASDSEGGMRLEPGADGPFVQEAALAVREYMDSLA